jgi:hypothetical protein
LGDRFQIVVHRDATIAATFQYSPCPEQLTIDISAMKATMVRLR